MLAQDSLHAALSLTAVFTATQRCSPRSQIPGQLTCLALANCLARTTLSRAQRWPTNQLRHIRHRRNPARRHLRMERLGRLDRRPTPHLQRRCRSGSREWTRVQESIRAISSQASTSRPNASNARPPGLARPSPELTSTTMSGQHSTRYVAKGLWVGVAGNQTKTDGEVLKALALPADAIATSAEWGVGKPNPEFLREGDLARRASSERKSPRRRSPRLRHLAGPHTALVRRGHWGHLWAADPIVKADATFVVDSPIERPPLLRQRLP